MDVSSLAAAALSSTAASTQNTLALSALKQQAQTTQAVVDLLATAAGAAQPALPAGVGTVVDRRA